MAVLGDRAWSDTASAESAFAQRQSPGVASDGWRRPLHSRGGGGASRRPYGVTLCIRLSYAFAGQVCFRNNTELGPYLIGLGERVTIE